MLDAELVEQGGVKVVDVYRVFVDAPADFVCFSVDLSALDATAGHEHGEGKRMVVTPCVHLVATAVLPKWSPAKLSSPNHERLVEQTALFQVLDQRRHRLIGHGGVVGKFVVEVTVVIPWDHHSNLDNELSYNATMADQPVAALIKDLKQRGLLDETLVIWGAEFGRTPLGENRGGNKMNTGRDHHPFAFSMFMAGGGIKGGQVYGKTDEIGWGIDENPVHVNDFHATLLNQFGIEHTKLTYRFQGRDFRLTDVGGNLIQPLIS